MDPMFSTELQQVEIVTRCPTLLAEFNDAVTQGAPVQLGRQRVLVDRLDMAFDGPYAEARITGLAVRTPEPAAAPWDGIGLPPIGTDCEIYWTAGEYVPVRIVGHDEDRAVFRLCQGLQKGTYGAASAREGTFRPMRTPEQIARNEAVDRMVQMCPYPSSKSTRIDCEALYDAGVRFPIGART